MSELTDEGRAAMRTTSDAGGARGLSDEQRQGIKHSVLRGVPLYSLAVGWSVGEGTLLHIAGISRAEHERRRVMRVAACKRGLDSAQADRAVAEEVAAASGDPS